MKALLVYKKRERGSVTHKANKLGNPGPGPHDWLILTPKDKMPKPEVLWFPKPPKAPDGSLIYERIPNKEPPVTETPAPASIPGAAAGVGGLNASATVSSDKPVPMVVSTSSSLKRRHNDNGLDSECWLREGELHLLTLVTFRTSNKATEQGSGSVSQTNSRAIPGDDGGCDCRWPALAQTSCK